MSGFAGRRLQLQLDFGNSLTTVAAATANGVTVNREPIDVTTKDDDGVRRLLTEIGTFSVDATVEGVISVDNEQIMTRAFSAATAAHLPGALIFATLGTMTGDFFLGSFELTGNEGAEALTFSATLMSSGTVTYTT